MSVLHILGTVICVLAITAGQLLFKRLGLDIQDGAALLSFRVAAVAVAAFTIYGAATVLWIYLLRFVALRDAYVFMALSFVLVPLAAHFFFGEELTPGSIAGALLVVSGIVVTMRLR
jgi:drug/metabolite transporter (DMT)-like permease